MMASLRGEGPPPAVGFKISGADTWSVLILCQLASFSIQPPLLLHSLGGGSASNHCLHPRTSCHTSHKQPRSPHVSMLLDIHLLSFLGHFSITLLLFSSSIPHSLLNKHCHLYFPTVSRFVRDHHFCIFLNIKYMIPYDSDPTYSYLECKFLPKVKTGRDDDADC